MEQKKIKLYLLSGFLGSGKTTFLKQLIVNLSHKKVGIIMNEFGKVSIDGTIIKKNDLDILEINNGSIFCSCLKGSFIEGLLAYAQLPIEYLFVEASGLADPSNIESILNTVVQKQRGEAFDYRGTICIVDGVHFLDHLDLFVSIEKQIKKGSFIVINKTDLVDENTLMETEEKIRSINPRAQIIRTSFCHIDFSFIEDKMMPFDSVLQEESSNRPENRPRAFVLKTKGRFDKEKLTGFLKSLSGDTFRMKGFFLLKEGWQLVDVVGKQIDIRATDIVQDQSNLVIISNGGTTIIKRIFENWEKTFDEKMILR